MLRIYSVDGLDRDQSDVLWSVPAVFCFVLFCSVWLSRTVREVRGAVRVATNRYTAVYPGGVRVLVPSNAAR